MTEIDELMAAIERYVTVKIDEAAPSNGDGYYAGPSVKAAREAETRLRDALLKWKRA